MRIIKVAAGVLNQTPLDWDGNASRISAAIEAAREAGVSLLCLPELCVTGYGCEDAFHSVGVQEMAKDVLTEIAAITKNMVVSVGLPVFHRGALYNTACLLADGKILGFVGKQNLAGEGLHYEPRWFKPWPDNAVGKTTVHEQTYPIGDLVFECGHVTIGFEICEDAWVPNRPGSHLAAQGIDILLNPSASHFAFGKHRVRRRFVLDGSRAFNVVYIYANLLGNEAGRAIYDGDAMIANCGKLLANGPRFSYREFDLTITTLDIDAVRVSRGRTGSFRPQFDPDQSLIQCDFQFKTHTPQLHTPSRDAWETSPRVKEEEFTRAVSLALFDYLRKSRSQGFVVSLSGGADSAAVAILCSQMVALARAELGSEFYRRLSYIADLPSDQPEATVARLLSCVYQSTRNSSDTTLKAAEGVAKAIGASFYHLDVDRVVQQYTNLVSDALARPLTWERDDLTLQNIQARARGPSVWMFANIRRALLLATSNRSEAAVGYATMDGDTCGGLSPIAGIDKAFLRSWLRWMETDGPQRTGPIPELSLVNTQAPTAELRPQASGQTDEADLMPYDLLDAIERAAIRDKQLPVEVFQLTRSAFPDYSVKQLAMWIERFFLLWSRNQWKRERYAPSFHVDDESLDPKTWCRFPILSGGYERELRELHQLVEKTEQHDT